MDRLTFASTFYTFSRLFFESHAMPITFTVNHTNRTVYTIAAGDLSADDFASNIDTLVKQGLFAYSQLIDARNANMTLSLSDVKSMVQLIGELRKIYGAASVAFIAPNPFVFGMLRMYMTLTEKTDSGFNVFYDMKSATEWLECSQLALQYQSA